MIEHGRDIARSPRRPDHVLLPDDMGGGRELLPVLYGIGVRAFFVAEGSLEERAVPQPGASIGGLTLERLLLQPR